MQEHCCDIYSKNSRTGRDFRSIGDILSDSNIAAMLAEKDKKLAKIRACPGPCDDGTISIKLQRGKDLIELHAVCPVAGPSCSYGISLQRQIDLYLVRLMTTRIGVPRRHVFRFDRCVDTIALKEAIRWGIRGFLVLSGKTGCGKSYAAAWFVNEHLKSRMGNPYKSESWKWHTRAESAASGVMWSATQGIVEDKSSALCAKSCSLLVLDDLGKECELPSAQAVIRDIISKRYDNELPTIITTELTITDIDAGYGRAIAERIVGEAEDGGRFVACGDVSLRLMDIKGTPPEMLSEEKR